MNGDNTRTPSNQHLAEIAPWVADYVRRKPALFSLDPRPSPNRAANTSLDAFPEKLRFALETNSALRTAIGDTRERTYTGADGEDVRMTEVMRRTVDAPMSREDFSKIAEAIALGILEGLSLLPDAKKQVAEWRAREAEEKEKKREMERLAQNMRMDRKRFKGIELWRKGVYGGEDGEGDAADTKKREMMTEAEAELMIAREKVEGIESWRAGVFNAEDVEEAI